MTTTLLRITLVALTACSAETGSGPDPIEPPPDPAPPDEPTALVAIYETANEGDPTEADMDDPAVWVHPGEPGKSLVVAAAKKGGLRVYGLEGQLVQNIPALLDAAGEPANRFNNVDVQYNFSLNGHAIDIAVATDRIQDQLHIWRIDPTAAAPLVDITSPAMIRAFPTRPDPDDRDDTIPNPDDGEHTAYGLALYHDVAADKIYALATQNAEAVIAQFELIATADGLVTARRIESYQFPYTYKGQDLTQESETDPNADFSPQFEGMSVDQRRGMLYAALEDVGLFRIDLVEREAETTPFYATSTFDTGSKLARDSEGVSIYYGPGGRGYLLVSSQGSAHGEPPLAPQPGLDDTFAVFALDGDNAYLGSFSIPANPSRSIDAVQECDGAEIASIGLPGFPHGLLITQDGYNDDLGGLDGATKATNLKLTPWDGVADNFPGGKLIKDTDYDPRHPER